MAGVYRRVASVIEIVLAAPIEDATSSTGFSTCHPFRNRASWEGRKVMQSLGARAAGCFAALSCVVIWTASCAPTPTWFPAPGQPTPPPGEGGSGSISFGDGGDGGARSVPGPAALPGGAEPPAISGGTLLVLADGTTAVAADPDRDVVWIVDLSTQSLLQQVALQPGDEPGRVAEDAAGRVHVALRRGGALLSIDPMAGNVLARRPVCPAPRGLAYDASADALHVACMDGRLVTLPAAGGAATRTVQVDSDLRDVVIQGGELYVSRFRAAELLQLAADGTVAQRITLPVAPIPEMARAPRRRASRRASRRAPTAGSTSTAAPAAPTAGSTSTAAWGALSPRRRPWPTGPWPSPEEGWRCCTSAPRQQPVSTQPGGYTSGPCRAWASSRTR